MLVPVLLLIAGLVILIFGANYMVEGASALAKKFNISNLAIGLTVVAFGTSAPELVVNTFAALQGHQDIVFGNVLGSNNFNCCSQAHCQIRCPDAPAMPQMC